MLARPVVFWYGYGNMPHTSNLYNKTPWCVASENLALSAISIDATRLLDRSHFSFPVRNSSRKFGAACNSSTEGGVCICKLQH